MELHVPSAGRYVVAVSGGVDSVVLLDILSRRAELDLVVAHFDHGIRTDSKADRVFVQELAQRYNMPFVWESGHLGEYASEATARRARYAFLETAREMCAAQAIITAHHQDDVLETAIINLMRGTGRRGLSSLTETAAIRRPFLTVRKAELLTFAHEHTLEWQEDSTNSDESYLRNYVRHRILTRFTESDKDRLLQIITNTQKVNEKLNTLLVKCLVSQSVNNEILRIWFMQLDNPVAGEIMAEWLRRNGLEGFDRRLIERLVVAAKTGRTGTCYDAGRGAWMHLSKESLALSRPER